MKARRFAVLCGSVLTIAALIGGYQNCSSGSGGGSGTTDQSSKSVSDVSKQDILFDQTALVFNEGEAARLNISTNLSGLQAPIQIDWRLVQQGDFSNNDPRFGSANGSFSLTDFAKSREIFVFSVDDSAVNGSPNPAFIEITSMTSPQLYWKIPLQILDND
jgi:hypothetical protein